MTALGASSMYLLPHIQLEIRPGEATTRRQYAGSLGVTRDGDGYPERSVDGGNRPTPSDGAAERSAQEFEKDIETVFVKFAELRQVKWTT